MNRKFFNYLIASFLIMLFAFSCNVDYVDQPDNDFLSEEITLTFSESRAACNHVSKNVKTIERVFRAIKRQKARNVLHYLSRDIKWSINGGENIYWGKYQVKAYLDNFNSLVKLNDIIINSHVEDGNIVKSYTRFQGVVPSTGKSFDMEYVFTWELNRRRKLVSVSIEYDSFSAALASDKEGQGHIVADVSVSPEALGMYDYFYQNIRDFFRSASVDVLRAGLDAPIPTDTLPADAEFEEVTLAGVDGEYIRVAGTENDKLILHFHGGAFVAGNYENLRLVNYNRVKATNIPVLSINFRRAPESPFSASVEDCLAVYEELLNEYDPDDIAFIGDSSGGNLVFAAILLAKEQSLPLPGAAVGISSWLDLTNSNDIYSANIETEALLSPELLDRTAAQYLFDASPLDPIASPVYGDLEDFPPVYLTASSSEMLLGDSAMMFEKLAAAGNDVTIEVGHGMLHVWPNLEIPEGVISSTRIADFIVAKLN